MERVVSDFLPLMMILRLINQVGAIVTSKISGGWASMREEHLIWFLVWFFDETCQSNVKIRGGLRSINGMNHGWVKCQKWNNGWVN